jgi:hypothetical protein
MDGPLRRFDMSALFAVLDEERRRQGMTWDEVTSAIDEPFRYVSSLPISASTIRGMLSKRTVTSAVILQILRWLGRSPESFLQGREGRARPDESLPVVSQSEILRLDTAAIYEALDAARCTRKLRWKEVAGQLPGFTEGMLRNLKNGPAIGFPRVMTLTQWLDRPLSSFARGYDR